MDRWIKILITSILVFSIYHLIRDVSTAFFNIHNDFVDFGHRDHLWCRPICPYITLPFEAYGIVASLVVLKRNKLGLLGASLYVTVSIWLLGVLLP